MVIFKLCELMGLTWAALCKWTQNHPKVVGISMGHHPKSYLEMVNPLQLYSFN